MTIKEFNELKIGDTVYHRDTLNKGFSRGTEVLEIDRIFKKVKVLLKSKPLSYRYFSKKSKNPVRFFVGVVKSPYF